MKLLLDQNISFRLCRKVAHVYPDSEHVGTIGLATAGDREIWQYAGKHNFILVSFDADVAEMAALLGPPPKVIWLRCGNQPSAVIERLLLQRHEVIAAFEHDPAACLEIY
jgi:predicted nuclease of predicted toxin-antitoxin system